MKKISLQQIADSLNISKTTVSLVLNNRGDANRINKSTQEKIIQFANDNNYKPNQLARSLSRGKSETIGLIIPKISDNFYAQIASHIEKKAQLSGYNVMYSSTEENPKREKELIHSMLDRQVDGLIIASTQKNKEDIEYLKQVNFPFVLIDRHYPDIETNYVIVDNSQGVTVAVNHLLNLGRKKIGFVSIKPELEAIRRRFEGYTNAVRHSSQNFDTQIIIELGVKAYEKEMFGAIKKLIQSPNNVDGIVFSTHYLTALGLRALNKLKKKVPSEVAIVSFDEMSAFDLINPPITSVIQPVGEIGNKAVDILMTNIESRTINNEQIILDTGFIKRKSCGA